jgi:hypothetical protein
MWMIARRTRTSSVGFRITVADYLHFPALRKMADFKPFHVPSLLAAALAYALKPPACPAARRVPADEGSDAPSVPAQEASGFPDERTIVGQSEEECCGRSAQRTSRIRIDVAREAA